MSAPEGRCGLANNSLERTQPRRDFMYDVAAPLSSRPLAGSLPQLCENGF
jgi:hypothetical protein